MILVRPPALLDKWRRSFGGGHCRIDRLRGAAALGYLERGPIENGLIELDKLTIVILYAHALRSGQNALRLAGFTGSPVPWGVRWGGADQTEFRKDLLLQPVLGGPGFRLDIRQGDLLRLGIALERELDRHVQHPRQRIQLPKLWAAFYHADAAAVTGDGPELASYSRRQGRSASELMAAYRREHRHTVLFPLPWVSHCWRPIAKTYVDLTRFPRRQVFAAKCPDDLAGFQAAAQFDFRAEYETAARSAALACA